jgi:chromosome partitioning protein
MIDDNFGHLGRLNGYRSLLPLAREARKPMFLLKPGDGAVGRYQAAVQACFPDFEDLAKVIEERIGLS